LEAFAAMGGKGKMVETRKKEKCEDNRRLNQQEENIMT
jgi:hypothetical protein